MTDEQQKGPGGIQDISDSKDEAEKTFLKELDEAEKSEPVSTSTPQAKDKEKAEDKSKSKFSAAMSAASKPRRKHSMDPILAVSLVILILASAVVLGNAAYSEYIEKGQTTTVAYGDTVAVRYTGSFNEMYDDTHTSKKAVVFDTNVEDVGTYLNKAENAAEHSWSWTYKTSFSDLSFTVGGDSVLKKFGSATINHKVGDVIKVHIDAVDGYELPDASKAKLATTTIDKEITMTASEFSALFGYTAPTTGISYMTYSDATKAYCPFGCSYSVCTIDSKVHVVNDFKTGGDFYAFGDDKAHLKITASQDGKYSIEYDVTINEDGKCTRAPVFHSNAWIVGYTYMSGSDKMYKIGETLGSDLNFIIKIVKITKA